MGRPQQSPSLKVLVVDDNEDAAELLSTMLSLLGFEAQVCFSGHAALATASVYRPDVVFLDLGMPEMNGFEVAQRLRLLPGCRHTYIAALTGWGDAATRLRTRQSGFDAHLQKPAALEQLLNVCSSAAAIA